MLSLSKSMDPCKSLPECYNLKVYQMSFIQSGISDSIWFVPYINANIACNQFVGFGIEIKKHKNGNLGELSFSGCQDRIKISLIKSNN